VIGDVGDDAGPVTFAELVAVTVNVYEVPPTSPVTVHLVSGALALDDVHDAPGAPVTV
jgi:hypothetical protein